MSDNLLTEIATFYDGCIKKYGTVAKGANWSSEEQQAVRFDYLIRGVECFTSPLKVAEIGCGYGALYKHLKARGLSIDTYLGYDISREMIKAAQGEIGDNADVILKKGAEISTPVEFSFASGIFNVVLGQDKSLWETQVFKTLNNMNEMSSNGFAFNLMTDAVDWEVDELYYANAGAYFDYCVKNFSRNVTLFHDMPMYEWTIIVRKDN